MPLAGDRGQLVEQVSHRLGRYPPREPPARPAGYADRVSEYELDPQEVQRQVAEGWQLVDVRTAEERVVSRIGGDRHIPVEELTERADEVDRERAVVFYCRVGHRSGMAAEAFRGSGYDAHNLAGGIEAWEAAGLPVERDDG